jgi:hypothetical protein
MTDGPGYGSQVILDGFSLNCPPDGSPSDAHGAPFWIDNRIVAIAREINDEPIFGRGRARGAVPPAANRDWQIIVTCVFQGERDVGGVLDKSDDSSWPRRVGYPARYCFFISRVGGGYDIALEGLPEVRDVGHSGQRKDEGIRWHFTTLFTPKYPYSQTYRIST